MSNARLVLIAALIGLPLAAQADEVYRWTDAQGSVNYGSKPPADARSIKKVDVETPNVVSSDAAADQRLADEFAKSREARQKQQAADDRLAAQKARADASRAAALADQARAQAALDCSNQWGVSCGNNGDYYPIVGARREPPLNGALPGSPSFHTPPTVPNTVPNTTPRTTPNTNLPGTQHPTTAPSVATLHTAPSGF
jgi:hypothetical protein